MYYEGKGILQNSIKAKEYYQKAANQGNVNALVNLGTMYDIGQGIPQDFKKAKIYFEKAIDKGSDLAKIKLGIKYQSGEGLPKDNKKALNLLQQGCKASPKLCDVQTHSIIAKLKAQ